MRTYFRSLSDVLGSPLAQTAQTFSPRHAGGHRVLKSTKLEDAAYRDLRRGDNELDALEKACGEKLSTFPALSRDIYQSFYSLNVRRQPEDAISEQARRFNAPILNEVMDGEDYPAIKAACEGRQLPAYEAASEFISQVAGNLDELLEKASGKKGALNTLERLEQKRDRSMEELQKLMKQIAQAGPEQLPELEKRPSRLPIRPRARSTRRKPWAIWSATRCSKIKRPSPAVLHRRYGRRHRKPKAFRRRFWPGATALTAMIRSGERRTWSWPPASARVPRSWRWPAIWGA